MSELPLRGLTIGITAERRAEEQARMFQARGAEILHGATVRVGSVGADDALREATADVIARAPDYVLASTGFGMRTWFTAAEGWGQRDQLIAALGRARVANRGAKAASVNRAAGLAEWWRAPNERLEELVEHVLREPIDGTRVVLQLHGAPEPDTVARLQRAGAEVIAIDAYHTSLPEDPEPARRLISAVSNGSLAAVTFTTAPAVHNLFALADRDGRRDQLQAAFNSSVVAACVGPVCAEGAAEEGILDPLVPERARLVPMVDTLTERLSSGSRRVVPRSS